MNIVGRLHITVCFQESVVPAEPFQEGKQKQMTSVHIEWNNCACLLTLYKQKVVCKFLISVNLVFMKSKQMRRKSCKAPRAVHLTKVADLKSVQKKVEAESKKKSASNSLLSCLYCS